MDKRAGSNRGELRFNAKQLREFYRSINSEGKRWSNKWREFVYKKEVSKWKESVQEKMKYFFGDNR